jgi:zinc transport system ATP-binding protein
VRLHPLLDGTVSLDHGAHRPGGVTYVPQRDSLDPVFPVTVLNVVMMGIAPRRGFGRPYRTADRRDAEAALDQVGLRSFAATPFRQLSGGEQQRTLIARALVSQATIMLLDEPTAAMDVDAERAVMDLIRKLAREHGMAVLMVSHGLNAVRRHADKVILLDREQQLIRIGNPREVLGVAMSSQVETFHRSWDEPAAGAPAPETRP